MTQWVRVEPTQVPPDERLARRSVGNPTGKPGNGSTKLEALCEQYSRGKRRKQNSKRIALMKARKDVLEQGEADPSRRVSLQSDLRVWNQRILQTPVFDYDDPADTRVKFLRYADDSAPRTHTERGW